MSAQAAVRYRQLAAERAEKRAAGSMSASDRAEIDSHMAVCWSFMTEEEQRAEAESGTAIRDEGWTP